MADSDERGDVDELDVRTPLDRTIDRIGMGASNSREKPVYDWKARRAASHLLPISRHVPMDFVIIMRLR